LSAPERTCSRALRVVLDTQTLHCLEQGVPVRSFEVSTARAGAGQRSGSLQTPIGNHLIRAKIGENQPEGAVFTGRRPTGEVWSPELHRQHPDRDWILTRILWLSGTEPGVNRLGNVDTMRRYIYIHGTPDCELLGHPASHGCVRMHSRDLVWLFDWVDAGTPVLIEQSDSESCVS